MQLLTYAQLKQKLQSDYDITDERFIDETDLVGYINEAIDDSETTIHTLHHEDKYFLCPTTISLVSQTQDYALPSNIYANKIRLMTYVNGTNKYPITRIQRLDEIDFVENTDDLRYVIINDETVGFPQIRFYPTPTETSTNVKLWYIRNMKRMTTSAASTNVCELPECVNFVYQHVRRSCAKKTRRQDLIQMEDEMLKQQYQAMCDALKDMTAEENTKVPMDLSAYQDLYDFGQLR
jgi:hypothetical protein